MLVSEASTVANTFSPHPGHPPQASGRATIRHLITLALFAVAMYFMLNAWGAWKYWQLIG